MDFYENLPEWATDAEPAANGYLHKHDAAVDRTIVRAIRDATQTADTALQQEAAAWLWICCPDIAEQVELPAVQYETLPALAAGYVDADTPRAPLA